MSNIGFGNVHIKLDNNEREWKYTLEFFSKRKNLRMYLMSKFDVNELPTNMPCYYVNAIKEWSRLSSLSVGDVDNISAQPLWYNREIKIGFKTVYNENLFSIGKWMLVIYLMKETFYHLIHGCVLVLMKQIDWHGIGIVNCIYKKWNIHNVCDNPTEPLIVKAYMMKCKFEQSALSRVALARWFIYKVMVLSKLHDRDAFFKLSQMFAEMV